MEIHDPKQAAVVVPPRWKLLVPMIAYCFLFRDLWKGISISIDDPATLFFPIYQSLIVMGVFVFGVHYKFTEKYLVVCFLWIPLRRIRWGRINHALFVHAWRDPKTRYQRINGPGPSVGQIIYVTIDYCGQWEPLYTSRWKHNVTHMFHACTIWLPYDRKAFFIEAFKKHYADLEMQPLDEWKKYY